MADQALYENLPTTLIKTLRTELGDKFATYWDGDPMLLGASQLPALIMEWESSDPAQAPTGHDKWQHVITCKVVVNKMDDASVSAIDGPGVYIQVPTRKKLESLLYARDKTTREYLQDTVIGVLRRKYTLGGKQNGTQASIRFGVSQRPTGDAENDTLITAEAHVLLNALELIPVTGRS